MRYLTFDLSDDGDAVMTLEALASTVADQHPAVLAEAQQVLDWAWRHFPHTHGPADDGMDWDHDLQVQVESGGWHSVTLTLSASPRFVEAFLAQFGDGEVPA
jgi:hypothetical protein